MELAKSHNLYVLEDCAQSHGAKWNGKMTGTMGTLSAFSFYPTKPLGAFGDAGAIVTNDDNLADKVRMLRNYGSRVKYYNEEIGRNSRLDEVQAAFLKVGLSHIEHMNQIRVSIAEKYLNGIHNKKVKLPFTSIRSTNVYHIFPLLVDNQKKFQEYMEYNEIKTQVHYPIPPYVANCYKSQGYHWEDYPRASYIARHEVSLPIYCGMDESEVDKVVKVINEY